MIKYLMEGEFIQPILCCDVCEEPISVTDLATFSAGMAIFHHKECDDTAKPEWWQQLGFISEFEAEFVGEMLHMIMYGLGVKAVDYAVSAKIFDQVTSAKNT